MSEKNLVKSVLTSKETAGLQRAVAAELAKIDENGRSELEKFLDLLVGAESPKPVAAQQD